MLQLRRWMNRAQRASVAITAVAAQFATFALFNNSTGAQLLALRYLFASATTGALINVFYTQNSALFPSPKIGTAIWPGTGVGPGQVSSSNQAAATAGDSVIPQNILPPIALEASYPIAVLPPGWAFILQDPTANTGWTATFLWDWFAPDEVVDFSMEQ